MKPKIKPNQAITIHRDGTVSFWDVLSQRWERMPAMHIAGNTLVTPTLTQKERNRILAAAAK